MEGLLFIDLLLPACSHFLGHGARNGEGEPPGVRQPRGRGGHNIKDQPLVNIKVHGNLEKETTFVHISASLEINMIEFALTEAHFSF